MIINAKNIYKHPQNKMSQQLCMALYWYSTSFQNSITERKNKYFHLSKKNHTPKFSLKSSQIHIYESLFKPQIYIFKAQKVPFAHFSSFFEEKKFEVQLFLSNGTYLATAEAKLAHL
jgi:hypothetical protein